jgi:hypothetical protein
MSIDGHAGGVKQLQTAGRFVANPVAAGAL